MTGAAAHAGGLVGFSNTSTISDNDASGNVAGTHRVGGLVGSAEGTVMRRNDASGNVSGSVHSVGGLAGHLYQSDVAINQATGSVVGDNSTDPAVENDVHNVGGLIGIAVATTISQSYAVNPMVSGVNNVGGLVGATSGTTISQSYAATTQVSGSDHVGGLIGMQREGTVSISYSQSSVSGSNNVGGLIGTKHEGIISISYSQSSIQGTNNVGSLIGSNRGGSVATAYAAGQVTASGSGVGGLIGINNVGINVAGNSGVGTITNSYWDITATGIAASAGGIGFADLRAATAPGDSDAEAFFQWRTENWDFGADSEYPILKDSTGNIIAQQVLRMQNIAVNGFTLIPAFNPDVRNYYVVVGNTPDTISLNVAASEGDAQFVVAKAGDIDSAVAVTGSDNDVSFDLNAAPDATELIYCPRL